MQGRSLKIAAAVLLGLAAMVGAYGVHLSQSAGVPMPVTVVAPPVNVIEYAVDLPAGTLIRSEMLRSVEVTNARKEDSRDGSDYLGRRLSQAVMAGTRLHGNQFAVSRPVLDTLEAGYRAYAISANALTVVGGHLQRGDVVDVLFLLRANKESGQNSTARRLLSQVKVLGVGGDSENQTTGSAQGKAQGHKQTGIANTITLAVPEQATPELLLAENTGQLRLALVGTNEHQPVVSIDNHDDTVRLSTKQNSTDQAGTDLTLTLTPQMSAQPVFQTLALQEPAIESRPFTIAAQGMPASPLVSGNDSSHVVALKTLGEYKEVDIVQEKPAPVKYRYVTPSVEIYQGESRTLVRTRH